MLQILFSVQPPRHEHSGSNENMSFLLTAIDNSFVKQSLKTAFVEVSEAFLYHCQTNFIKQQLIQLQLKKFTETIVSFNSHKHLILVQYLAETCKHGNNGLAHRQSNFRKKKCCHLYIVNTSQNPPLPCTPITAAASLSNSPFERLVLWKVQYMNECYALLKRLSLKTLFC